MSGGASAMAAAAAAAATAASTEAGEASPVGRSGGGYDSSSGSHSLLTLGDGDGPDSELFSSEDLNTILEGDSSLASSRFTSSSSSNEAKSYSSR